MNLACQQLPPSTNGQCLCSCCMTTDDSLEAAEELMLAFDYYSQEREQDEPNTKDFGLLQEVQKWNDYADEDGLENLISGLLSYATRTSNFDDAPSFLRHSSPLLALLRQSSPLLAHPAPNGTQSGIEGQAASNSTTTNAKKRKLPSSVDTKSSMPDKSQRVVG